MKPVVCAEGKPAVYAEDEARGAPAYNICGAPAYNTHGLCAVPPTTKLQFPKQLVCRGSGGRVLRPWYVREIRGCATEHISW